jgi:hypothetical protein
MDGTMDQRDLHVVTDRIFAFIHEIFDCVYSLLSLARLIICRTDTECFCDTLQISTTVTQSSMVHPGKVS